MAASANGLPNRLSPSPQHLSYSSNSLRAHHLLRLPFHHSNRKIHRTKLRHPSLSPLTADTSTQNRETADHSREISRLCLCGRLDEALLIMNSSDGKLHEDAYVSLLNLCERRRAFQDGSRVCFSISSSKTHITLRLGNALLSMLVRFGDLLEAWKVFGKMIQRDLFSWNVMVGGYAKSGFFNEALDLYHRMIWAGFSPDIYTFPPVLRSCSIAFDLVRGREIHGHVFRYGMAAEVNVLNALVTMYSKCGNLVGARKVFDGMPSRDSISWNAMIAGYFENGEFFQGFDLFWTMRGGGSIEPDSKTMTSVISAFGSSHRNLRSGRAIHGYAAKCFPDDVPVQNSLVWMYSVSRGMEEAEKVFGGIEYRDVISWTAMITAYEQNGMPNKALELFREMKEADMDPDEVTLASLLSACSSLGRLDVGTDLHGIGIEKGFTQSPFVENALIEMYSKSGCFDKALLIFQQMSEKNVISWSSIISGFRINRRSFEALNYFREMQAYVEPNSVSLIAALSACGAVGAVTSGKEIHARVLRRELTFKGFVPNALLDFYTKCGKMRYAWAQFNLHKDKDVVSWNIMIAGCAGLGDGDLAISLFAQMEELGLRPNEVTFLVALRACGLSGKIDQGLNYFKIMKEKYAIEPNLKHYACIVDLLGRSGQLERAFKFIVEDMPVKPDAAVWGALLNGCRIHRQVGLGELAAGFLLELDPDSEGYYTLVSNLYADNGMWDRVARVRKEMKQRGFLVDPGCSWVEVKGALHAFLSGEESHPRIKEITEVLEGLYGRIQGNSPGFEFSNEMESAKAEIFCGHSERFALAFGLINSMPGMPIWVTKNLFMCQSCHATFKSISRVVRREITVRDADSFHRFKDGKCSCGEEGYMRVEVE